MKMRAVIFTYTDDGVMKPLPRFEKLCWQQFVVGLSYPMEVVEPRSMKSHSHYFACIHTAFENLPEAMKEEFKSEEGLRAKALVATGFCTERDFPCDTPSKAKYLATVIRTFSEYSIIKISGDVVKVFEPKSQALNAMKPDEFQAAKTAVLDWIEALNPGLKLRDIKKEAAKIAPDHLMGG